MMGDDVDHVRSGIEAALDRKLRLGLISAGEYETIKSVVGHRCSDGMISPQTPTDNPDSATTVATPMAPTLGLALHTPPPSVTITLDVVTPTDDVVICDEANDRVVALLCHKRSSGAISDEEHTRILEVHRRSLRDHRVSPESEPELDEQHTAPDSNVRSESEGGSSTRDAGAAAPVVNTAGAASPPSKEVRRLSTGSERSVLLRDSSRPKGSPRRQGSLRSLRDTQSSSTSLLQYQSGPVEQLTPPRHSGTTALTPRNDSPTPYHDRFAIEEEDVSEYNPWSPHRERTGSSASLQSMPSPAPGRRSSMEPSILPSWMAEEPGWRTGSGLRRIDQRRGGNAGLECFGSPMPDPCSRPRGRAFSRPRSSTLPTLPTLPCS
eukprot:m.94418 g.94418  ORF g.94418 m.94418 type:complete len:379 (-) comp20365_c1_seq1:267-1403(-)